MPVYLVRHAHAGRRADWDEDDALRPLSARGLREAEHIAQLIGDEPIGRIRSSPAVRCVQTVTPLATRRGLKVKEDPRLAEGADVGEALELMTRLAEKNPMFCAHGDLIPEAIRLLRRRHMELVEDGPTRKGSFWVLEFDGEAFTKATYHPPGPS
jgi:8-oxo-dGTP diphosphatase